MLSWETNLVLIAVGLIYPMAMAIRDHYRKKGEESTSMQSQPGKKRAA